MTPMTDGDNGTAFSKYGKTFKVQVTKKRKHPANQANNFFHELVEAEKEEFVWKNGNENKKL